MGITIDGKVSFDKYMNALSLMMNCQNNSNNIYPGKIKITREKGDPCRASLLDISVEFQGGSV